jgi:hypothetical protein
MSVNYEQTYQDLLIKTMQLQKDLRMSRVKRVLVALAKMKNKSRYVKTVEERLSIELQSHNRCDRVQVLLELLECDEDVMAHLYK